MTIFRQLMVRQHDDRRSMIAKAAQYAEAATLPEQQIKDDYIDHRCAHPIGRVLLVVYGSYDDDLLERRERLTQPCRQHLRVLHQQHAQYMCCLSPSRAIVHSGDPPYGRQIRARAAPLTARARAAWKPDQTYSPRVM